MPIIQSRPGALHFLEEVGYFRRPDERFRHSAAMIDVVGNRHEQLFLVVKDAAPQTCGREITKRSAPP